MRLLSSSLIGSVVGISVVALLIEGAALNAYAGTRAERERARVQLSSEQVAAFISTSNAFRSTGNQSSVRIVIPLNAGSYAFDLIPHAETLAAGAENSLIAATGAARDSLRIDQFRNISSGSDFLRLTFSTPVARDVKHEVYGLLRAGGKVFSVRGDGRSRDREPSVNLRLTEILESDLASDSGVCGHRSATAPMVRALLRGETPSIAAALSERMEIKIAVEADYEFYQEYGEETSGQMASIIDGVNALYSPLNLKFTITSTNVWTDNSAPNYPYGAGLFDILMNQALNYWEPLRAAGSPWSYLNPGLIHVFTGKTGVNNGHIGKAKQRSICNGASASVVQYIGGVSAEIDLARAVTLSAHELGHELGMLHPAPDVPTSIMTGSGIYTQSSFDSANIGLADSYLSEIQTNTPGCLVPVGPAFYSLAGKVTVKSRDGIVGIGGVTVQLTTSAGSFLDTTAADGSFGFDGLAEGTSYTLRALLANPLDQVTPGSVSGVLTRNTQTIFELNQGKQKLSKIRGVVQRYVKPRTKVSGVTLLLQSTSNPSVAFTTTTSTKGRYTFPGLVADTYQVSASGGPANCSFVPKNGSNTVTIRKGGQAVNFFMYCN